MVALQHRYSSILRFAIYLICTNQRFDLQLSLSHLKKYRAIAHPLPKKCSIAFNWTRSLSLCPDFALFDHSFFVVANLKKWIVIVSVMLFGNKAKRKKKIKTSLAGYRFLSQETSTYTKIKIIFQHRYDRLRTFFTFRQVAFSKIALLLLCGNRLM